MCPTDLDGVDISNLNSEFKSVIPSILLLLFKSICLGLGLGLCSLPSFSAVKNCIQLMEIAFASHLNMFCCSHHNVVVSADPIHLSLLLTFTMKIICPTQRCSFMKLRGKTKTYIILDSDIKSSQQHEQGFADL